MAAISIGIALLLGACVDEERVGVSTGLLIVEPLASPLRPGSSTELAFQAIDDNGDGVPDQTVEVVITDTTRLRFKGSAESRILLMTGRSDRVNGVLLSGAIVVQLEVPKNATPGSLAVVASLAGDRGATSKTQWADFQIGEGGSATGGEGGGAGAAGEAGMGGTGAASGSKDDAGTSGGVAGAPN